MRACASGTLMPSRTAISATGLPWASSSLSSRDVAPAPSVRRASLGSPSAMDRF